MTAARRLFLGVGVSMLVLAGAAALLGYGAAPFARAGLPSTLGRDATVAAFRAAGEGFSVADTLFCRDGDHLVAAPLTPSLVRALAGTHVAIRPLRDLPGVLPLLLLAALAATTVRAARRRDRPPPRVAWRVIAVGALEAYLWCWTIAAGHDLTTPSGADWATRAPGLRAWLYSIPVQLLLAGLGLLVIARFVRQNAARPWMPLIVAALFVADAAGTLVMFPPEPYFRFIVVAWWPLLFVLGVLAMGGACLLALSRASSESA